MATSQAQICNKALARLGIVSFIEDLGTSQSAEAATLNVFYADVLDACLAVFPWPFATLRATLAELALEPARDGWNHVYALPSDCLVPRKVWPSGQSPELADLYGPLTSQLSLRAPRADQRVPFAIEKASLNDGKVLLCDYLTPTLFYTARVTDTARFPPLFVDAFAWLLASEVALALTGKEDKMKACLLNYRVKIQEAQAGAWNEQQEDQLPEVDILAARR
jgi:hypothetical protein